MLKYTLRRLLTFIPMLIAISLIAFIISINAPGDPVDRLTKAAGNEGGADQQSGAAKKDKEKTRKKLGLDLPIFYFSIGDIASSDTLHKIQDRGHRENLEALTHQYGNWTAVSNYYHALLYFQSSLTKIDIDKKFEQDLTIDKVECYDLLINLNNNITGLLTLNKLRLVNSRFDSINKIISNNHIFNPILEDYEKLKGVRKQLEVSQTRWKTYIPSIKWYGSKNQYHLWLIGDMSYYPFKTIIKFKNIFKTKSEIPQVFSEMCKNRTDSIYYEEYLNTSTYKDFSNISSQFVKFSKDTTLNADSLYTALYKENISQIENLINTIRHPDGVVEKNRRKGLLRGDFGISYADSQPIKYKIWEKVGISFTLSILSIILAYLVSIPIGIYSAYKKDSLADRGMSLLLFILYSLPTFFVGTVLLLLFANPDFLVWFPESGIKDPTIWSNHPEWSDSFWDIFNWEKIKHQAPYLVLPLVTYTYGSFAFLSRIMRVGMIDIVSQDYIRTARAKGLGEGKVILKHALRNSLLPIITVFAAIFPMSIGGSIIIEFIFSIPGMGSEILLAIYNYDYPMIIAFFTLIGFLTMVGYLVADLLYAIVDPRISYK